jgi:serpin B
MSGPDRRRLLIRAAAFAFWGAWVARGPFRAAAETADLPDDISALTEAYNASGRALLGDLSRTPGNVVLSPYSIGVAMAMALSGARGATEEEMTKALMQTLPRPRLDLANQHLMEALLRNGGTTPENRILIGNALVAAGPRVEPDYLADVKTHYRSRVFRQAKTETINAWVSEKTGGMIPNAFGDPPKNLALLLINAIYFKAAWANPFKTEFTKDGEFQLADGRRVTKPMMHLRSKFPFVNGQGFRAIRIPFSNETLGFIVVLPDETDGVDAVLGTLGADEQKALLGQLGPESQSEVELAMPKFKIDYSASLKDAFKALGMRLAFTDAADFSGIFGERAKGFYIDQILHIAVIEISEQGVKAAAVTALPFQKSAPRPEPKIESFIVDRPFLFFVVDHATGAVLFEGRVAEPN